MKRKKDTLRIKKHIVILIIFTLFISILSIFLFAKLTPSKAADTLPLLAEKIIEKCNDATDRFNCYNKEIPSLMDKPTGISMEDAFIITRFVQEKDPSFAFCHVLGHELSAKEVKKDPTNWKKVLTRCPSGVCSNGCLHGGLQERYRNDTLTDSQIDEILPDLASLCEARTDWNPTDIEQASCYHAIGHLLMYITKADTQKASNFCEQVAKKEDGRDFRQVCFDGVFMQIYQPLDPEDVELIKEKTQTKDTVSAFCSQFSVLPQSSCFNESWPLFFNEVTTPQGLITFCEKVDESQRERCYTALFYVLTAQFRFELPAIRSFCRGLPEEKAMSCFSNAATRMIETDFRNTQKAIALCADAKTYFSSDACFENLADFAKYNFREGSEEKETFCSQLPPVWRITCHS